MNQVKILSGLPKDIEKEINDIKKEQMIVIMGVTGDADKTVVVIELFPKAK